MQGQITPEAVRTRIVTAYRRVYKNLLELVAALNVIEPGGTLLEDVVIIDKKEGRIGITYSAVPLQVTISSEERKFILKVIEDGTAVRP